MFSLHASLPVVDNTAMPYPWAIQGRLYLAHPNCGIATGYGGLPVGG